jgi:hypothetical protein
MVGSTDGGRSNELGFDAAWLRAADSVATHRPANQLHGHRNRGGLTCRRAAPGRQKTPRCKRAREPCSVLEIGDRKRWPRLPKRLGYLAAWCVALRELFSQRTGVFFPRPPHLTLVHCSARTGPPLSLRSPAAAASPSASMDQPEDCTVVATADWCARVAACARSSAMTARCRAAPNARLRPGPPARTQCAGSQS